MAATTDDFIESIRTYPTVAEAFKLVAMHVHQICQPAQLLRELSLSRGKGKR